MSELKGNLDGDLALWCKGVNYRLTVFYVFLKKLSSDKKLTRKTRENLWEMFYSLADGFKNTTFDEAATICLGIAGYYYDELLQVKSFSKQLLNAGDLIDTALAQIENESNRSSIELTRNNNYYLTRRLLLISDNI